MLELIKTLLGMKLGVLLLIIFGGLIGLSFLKNLITGSFSIAKFAAGFNPFTGSVQGKLIYYALIAFACFTVYRFVMRDTYSADYKNNIKGNQDVFIDQKVGTNGCAVNLFFGLIKIGCNPKSMTKTVNNNCGCQSK